MRTLFIAVTIALCAIASSAQTAVLRFSQGNVYVDVNLAGRINPAVAPTQGGLYGIRNGNWIAITPLPLHIQSPYTKFTIAFPKAPSPLQYDPAVKYKVVLWGVFSDQDGKSIPPYQTIDVSSILLVKLERDPFCAGITLLIESPVPYDFGPIYRWLNQFAADNSQLGRLTVRRLGTANEVPIDIDRFAANDPQAAQANNVVTVCIRTRQQLPAEGFTAKLRLNGPNLPTDILSDPVGQELAGVIVPPAAKDTEIKDPEKRKLERNLDLGVSFTSSVADVTTPASGSTPAVTTRKRTNRGVLDLRFAPWMNVFKDTIDEDKWLKFLTPFYINANVATGKITKDTLALNRVLLGLEGEFRYYKSKTTYDKDGKIKSITHPVWHRIIYGFTHASDRDFKQDEFTGKIEYAPIFEAVYRPYALNYYVDANNETHQRWYGFTFRPRVGFEAGRTYRRHNPASAIKPSDTVRRLYFATDLGLDLTGHFTLSASDTFYIRGETPEHRTRNYFKGQLDFRFRPERLSSGLFVMFERGELAPFATPDVNAFKIGFRLLGDFCSQSCR